MHQPASHTVSFAAQRARRVVWIGGFCMLGVMTVLLYGLALRQAWTSYPILAALVALLLALVLAACIVEFRTAAFHVPWPFAPRAVVFTVAGVIGGALATYWLSCRLDLGAVVAAGLVGLLAALFIAAYSGTSRTPIPGCYRTPVPEPAGHRFRDDAGQFLFGPE